MVPIDPNMIQTFLQFSQLAVSAETNRYNAAIRDDIAWNTLLTTEMNHEHQLRMFRLQENSRRQEKWLELGLRKEIKAFDSFIDEHRKRFEGTLERFYVPGNFLAETLPNEPYPYIIISQNPNQKFNTYGNGKDTPIIAPLNRITDTIRKLNSTHENNKLLTILGTNEYFSSESDVRRFYNHEINCPSVIVYSNFTSESLAINAYVSGIYDKQRSSKDEIIDIKSNHELLWNIPYSLIKKFKESPTELQWQSHLSEITSNLVVLNIQRYLDEYFKFYPTELYSSKTLEFINSKKEILEKQFPELVKNVQELNESISSLEKFKMPKKQNHSSNNDSLFIK